MISLLLQPRQEFSLEKFSPRETLLTGSINPAISSHWKMPQDFRKTFEFSVWPGERIEWFLRVIVNIEQNCPRQQAENLFTSNWAYIPCLIFLLGQCKGKVKVVLLLVWVFCCRNLAVLRRHSVCEAIQTQAGTQDNTLAEDEILSAITDSNGPYPETAKTYQYIWPNTKINKTCSEYIIIVMLVVIYLKHRTCFINVLILSISVSLFPKQKSLKELEAVMYMMQ